MNSSTRGIVFENGKDLIQTILKDTVTVMWTTLTNQNFQLFVI